ncbi:hypothetical protein NDU88_004098 [Pleurodeles waltl]|uniref:Uncharacterized protein n=1 Tax=Pleurodeles waltl TaxID=8319 RepID=A0AAV7RIJ3_PLEWA|nr:hypothetical protein NDU88_004098 [Pleurodeles waltl]
MSGDDGGLCLLRGPVDKPSSAESTPSVFSPRTQAKECGIWRGKGKHSPGGGLLRHRGPRIRGWGDHGPPVPLRDNPLSQSIAVLSAPSTESSRPRRVPPGTGSGSLDVHGRSQQSTVSGRLRHDSPTRLLPRSYAGSDCPTSGLTKGSVAPMRGILHLCH